VRQRQFKMPATKKTNKEIAEHDQPTQSQPDTERYLLQIDRQSKRSFKSPEVARKAAPEIKASLQVSIYDTVIGSRTMVELPDSAS
jgi:hypothetical protein